MYLYIFSIKPARFHDEPLMSLGYGNLSKSKKAVRRQRNLRLNPTLPYPTQKTDAK
jgi:hypothetical protein